MLINQAALSRKRKKAHKEKDKDKEKDKGKIREDAKINVSEDRAPGLLCEWR